MKIIVYKRANQSMKRRHVRTAHITIFPFFDSIMTLHYNIVFVIVHHYLSRLVVTKLLSAPGFLCLPGHIQSPFYSPSPNQKKTCSDGSDVTCPSLLSHTAARPSPRGLYLSD